MALSRTLGTRLSPLPQPPLQ